MSDTENSGSNRVPPLNMTVEERRTLIHCLLAGHKDAIEHFGEGERERVKSLAEKLDTSIPRLDEKGAESDNE